MLQTITFQPNKEAGYFIEKLLNTGEFNNKNEIISAGLELLQEQTMPSKLKKLRQLIDEAENSPVIDNWNINEFLTRTINKQ